MTLDEMQSNLSRKYENLKRIMSGLPPILDDAREGVQNMRQGVQNVREGFQNAVQPSLNAVREGVKNDLGPSTRGVVQGSLEGFPEAAQQIKGSFSAPVPPDDPAAADQLQQALLGLWRPRSSPTAPPPMPEDKPAPQPTQRPVPGKLDRSVAAPLEFRTGNQPNFNAAMQNQNAGNDIASQFGQFDKEFNADLAAGRQRRGQERVDAANAYNKSFEEMLDQNINMRRGMENRNIRAYNGGGPTPGMVGFNASMQNEADIGKQMAARNPSVDPLSPLQMRGEVESPQEDARDMTSEGVEGRLRAAFGVRPGQDPASGRLQQYDSPRSRNGKPNPFYSATTSTVGEDGNVQFRTQYLPQSAADFDQAGPTVAVPGGTSTPATLSDRPAERAREANRELMAKRRAAPAQARLNQLQFTQKQLANALSGKPMDNLPKDLSADAANELVRGSARMYRRGENARNMQMAQEAGFSPDRNPQVREAVAKGAFDNKKAKEDNAAKAADAALRDALAGKQMESAEKIAAMRAKAEVDAAKATADGMSARGQGGDMQKLTFGATLDEIENELKNPNLTPDDKLRLINEKRQLMNRQPLSAPPLPAPKPVGILEALLGTKPKIPPSPSATESPMSLPYIPAPDPNDKRKKTGRQPWMDIDPTFGQVSQNQFYDPLLLK